MPPPIFDPGRLIRTMVQVPARLCLGKRKGYKKISLPPGEYYIDEVWRNEEYWHDYEHSDGYTYRLSITDNRNSLYGRRISIWQNDLWDGIEGSEGEGSEAA